MRLSRVAIVVLLGLSGFGCQMSSSAEKMESAGNLAPARPVLVELFTSEGCSSCPPADKALAFLEQQQPVSGAQIVALELHVDYWDGPAWKDPFSSAQFSERQNQYAGRFHLDQVYTPQMVVDGSSQFTGSDLQTANIMIVQFAKDAKANVVLMRDGEKIKINIDSLQQIPQMKDATVFLAIAENNLNTDIKGGENSGRKLSHTAVVRELRTIGNITAGSKDFTAEAVLNLQKTWKLNDLKAVVFVQENESRKVLGIGQLSLAG
jgi:hypothetical protein